MARNYLGLLDEELWFICGAYAYSLYQTPKIRAIQILLRCAHIYKVLGIESVIVKSDWIMPYIW